MYIIVITIFFLNFSIKQHYSRYIQRRFPHVPDQNHIPLRCEFVNKKYITLEFICFITRFENYYDRKKIKSMINS